MSNETGRVTLYSNQGQEFHEGDAYPEYIPSPEYTFAMYKDDKYTYETGDEPVDSSGFFDQGKFLGYDVSPDVQDTIESIASLPVGGGKKLAGKAIKTIGKAIAKKPEFIDALDTLANLDDQGKAVAAGYEGAIAVPGGNIMTEEYASELVMRSDPKNDILIDIGLANPVNPYVIQALHDRFDTPAESVSELSNEEYNETASKGRYGDTELADVKDPDTGKTNIEHVNTKELKLKEKYGSIADDIIKDIGAGTINPDTGLKENHLWHAHGSHIGLLNNMTFAGGGAGKNWWFGENSIGNWWLGEDSFFGSKGPLMQSLKGEGAYWKPWHGQWGFLGETSGARERREQYGSPDLDAAEMYTAENVVQDAIKSFDHQLDKSLGPDGFIAKGKKATFDAADTAVEQFANQNRLDTRNIVKEADLKLAKSGLAASGFLEEDEELAMTVLADKHDDAQDARIAQQDAAKLATEQSTLDLVSSIQSELNTILLDYQSTTEEVADDDWSRDLKTRLDDIRQNA